MNPAGLPHSEIPGSKVVCTYPRLIAAYHVLHRFPEPRHPPCALSCLTSISGLPRFDLLRKPKTTSLRKNSIHEPAGIVTFQHCVSTLCFQQTALPYPRGAFYPNSGSTPPVGQGDGPAVPSSLRALSKIHRNVRPIAAARAPALLNFPTKKPLCFVPTRAQPRLLSAFLPNYLPERNVDNRRP